MELWARYIRDGRLETLEQALARFREALEAGDSWGLSNLSSALLEWHKRTGEDAAYWRVMPGDGTVTIYGRTTAARIADPDNAARVFRWLPQWSFDDKGNCFEFEYKPEDLVGVAATPSETAATRSGVKACGKRSFSI